MKEGTLFNSYIMLKGKPDPFTAPLLEGAGNEGRDTARANLTLSRPPSLRARAMKEGTLL